MTHSNRRFFAQYLLVLGLLLLIFLSVYSAVSGRYRQEIRENCLENIRESCEQLRDEVQRLNFVCSSLRVNRTFHEVSNKQRPYTSRDLYTIKKLQTDIQSMMSYMFASDDLLIEMGVLLSNQICLTGEYCFPNADEWYPVFFRYGDLSLGEWEQLVRGREYDLRFLPAMTCTNYRDEECRVIQLSCSVPNPFSGTMENVFFLLDAEAFISFLAPRDVLETGAVEVSDRKNSALLVSFGDWEQASSDMVTYEDSLNGLFFRVMIPRELIARKTLPMRRIFYLGFLVYLLIGLLLSLFFSRKNARPLDSIVTLIHTYDREAGNSGEPAYQVIEKSFRRIGIDLKRAEALIAEQSGNLRSAQMERLIGGLIYTQEDWAEVMREFPDFPEKYCVMYMTVLSDENEVEAKRILCERQMRACLGEKLIIHLTEKQLLLAVLPLNVDYPVPESYRPKLLDVIHILQDRDSVSVLSAVSAAFDTVQLIHEACRQARHLLRFENIRLQEKILFYGKMKLLQPDRYADLTDSRLGMLIRNGDRAMCLQQIRYMAEEINRVGPVDESFLHLTFDSVRQVFCQLHYDLKTKGMEPPMLPSYSQKLNVGQLFESIRVHAEQLCESFEKVNKRSKESQEKEILGYIDRNVFDHNLCVQQILDQFGISERTLQRYMHNAAGKSFFEYISDIRLEKARELVRKTDMPIQEIGRICAFDLPNTFYKAYSRRWGVSPISDRKNSESLSSEQETTA